MNKPDKPFSFPGSSHAYLNQAIASRIEIALTEVRLPDKTGELVPIKIISAYFDPDNYEDIPLPAVLHRTTAGVQQKGDDGEERIGTVEIALGIRLKEYGDDEYAVSIMERIEHVLLKQRILDRKYRLQLPLSWTILDKLEQPWPYWWATMTATYLLPTIAEVYDENEETFIS